MGLPILLVDTSAFWTGPGGVPGIYDIQINAVHQGLVGQEGAELIEGPVVQPVSLAFSGRNLIPDAGEILDGNSGVSAFGLGNKVFGNVVIHPRLKTVLPTGKFLESSSGGFCSFLLENGPAFLIPQAFVLHDLSREDFACGIGGDVDDAEVHPEDVDGKFRFLLGDIAGQVDEPFLVRFGVDEIDLSLPEPQITPLVLPADEGDFHAPGNGPEANLIPLFEGEDPVIVGLGGPLPEDVDGRPVRPIGVGDFGEASDDHLGRERGVVPDGMVAGFVQGKLPEGLRLEGEPGQIVAQGVAYFERFGETLRLSVRWLKFKVDRYLHSIDSILDYLVCQPLTKRRGAFLPGMNAGVSNAR